MKDRGRQIDCHNILVMNSSLFGQVYIQQITQTIGYLSDHLIYFVTIRLGYPNRDFTIGILGGDGGLRYLPKRVKGN